MHQTLRSWAFWNLTGGTALRLIAKTGVTVHIIPIMVSKGVSEKTAAFVFGLQLFMTVPMYLILGWAADRFPKSAVLMGASLAGTLSLALLASPFHGLGMLLAFVLLFAVCDGCAPTNWAVVGEYFGRKTFSRLRGYIQFANFPGVLFAPVFVGWWYDHHHSYAFPLWVYTGVSLVGALTFAVLKRPPSNAPVPGEETPAPQVPAAESPQASD
jgi:MFS family permease